ncbi:MAG: YdcF family protein [Deltaproteobacteria bacterium]|nr:YdcF family protein [Deltaproteobacteria bacterium]
MRPPASAIVGALLGPVAFVGAANALVVASTRAARTARVDALAPADVAVVPGARVFPGDVPSVPLRERLLAAAELLDAGVVARVLVSGARRDAGRYDEARAMAAFLRERGVPAERLLADAHGHRTIATMRNARAALGPEARVVVCTQAFHLARAVFLARRAGLDAAGYEVDRRLDPFALQNAAREAVARAVAVAEVALAPLTSARAPSR